MDGKGAQPITGLVGPRNDAATPPVPGSDQFRGWLYKWTNYIRGYQKRWFVLQNGLLSYYRNQAEMQHSCRGTVNLANAVFHTGDSSNFVIANGGTRTLHLKASSEVERQRWVTALELSKARAISQLESDDDLDGLNNQADQGRLNNVMGSLNTKLTDLTNCNDQIVKNGAALQRALSELEQMTNPVDMSSKIKSINERATLFRITSKAMINACNEYLEMAQSQGKRWQKMLQNEREQRTRLEEMVEQLGKQHSNLEKQVRRTMANPLNHNHSAQSHAGNGQPDVREKYEDDHSEEDDFYDALGEQMDEFKVCLPPEKKKTHHRSPSGLSVDSMASVDPRESNYDSSETDSEHIEMEASVLAHRSTGQKKDKKQLSVNGKSRGSSSSKLAGGDVTYSCNGDREIIGNHVVKTCRRTTIAERPNYSLNLWSIMKNCIGKELSKIPMPVNFSEPLSFLQRLTEDFEYSDCLHKAAAADDIYEQFAYVAAFTVSSYATTTTRTLKPFNPLLGETFECDRMEDYGWRSVAEQVSHHPPMVAMFTESNQWSSWQEFTMSSKFRGKYLQIIPLGVAHLLFSKTNDHYTWRKVATTVHNIIVGRLWVDNHGEMDITNHRTGDTCHLKYSAYSYFSRDTPRKVTGVITDSSGKAQYVLSGTWDDKMEGARVINTVETSKGKVVYETGETKVLWQRRYPSAELERCYNFTQFSVELNEPEEGVAPTDSRNRPDQRKMEEGDWDEANRIKVLLEDKQRAARRQMEQNAVAAANIGEPVETYSPKWFKKEQDEQTGNLIHLFTGEYWKHKDQQDWSRCPDIYV